MKKSFRWVTKFRIDELSKHFFINCGVLFVMLNLVNLYWPRDSEPFGGFGGQLICALVISVAVTYFSPRKSKGENDNDEVHKALSKKNEGGL